MQNTRKQVNNKKSAKKNSPPRTKKGGPGQRALAIPPYAQTILRPFQAAASHIPDERVGPAGLVVSRQMFRTTVVSSAAIGTSTSHSFGIILPPYPRFVWLSETSAGNGILTDLFVDGTQWVTPTGGNTDVNAPPNITGIFGSSESAKIRAVGMGVRITYEGTELNRSGRVIVGMLRASLPSNSVAVTGTKLSLLSTVVGSPTAPVTTIRQAMENTWECRNEKTVEAHWIPDGVPTYQMGSAVSTTGSTFGTTAGAIVTPSGWNSPDGGFGVESGQNMLCVIVDNDTTSTAVSTSNLYAIDIIWHWEVCPNDVTAVTYEVTDSPANTMAVDRTLNVVSKPPVARLVGSATSGFQ